MKTKQVTIEYLHAYLSGIGAKFANDLPSEIKPQIANYNRRMRDEVRRDLGLKRVKGNLGTTYWE